MKNEDVGAAPTTSEWSTIYLPTKVRLLLETWRYIIHIGVLFKWMNTVTDWQVRRVSKANW